MEGRPFVKMYILVARTLTIVAYITNTISFVSRSSTCLVSVYPPFESNFNTLDETWVVIKVPQGGYTLGLIVEGALTMQSPTKHDEIIHVTAHFLRTTIIAPFEIHIQRRHMGRHNTTLVAEFIQKRKVRILSHLIFKGPSINSDPKLTLPPSSPLSRHIPLHTHPSVCKYTPNKLFFHDLIRRSEDQIFIEDNIAKAQGGQSQIGGGMLEWGAWVQLRDPSEQIKVSMLPFLADIIGNLPSLLPRHMKPEIAWHPTMFLSLEYKFPIPDGDKTSKHTVGIYSRSTFMHEGRHDVYVEVWTAPSNVGTGIEIKGWREDQVCLAISQQMVLAVPSGVNERKASEARL